MAYTTIDDPSAHFQTVLWTGDGNSTQAITNTGNSDLQPDFIWSKLRSGANSHHVSDTSRGITIKSATNNTNAEGTDATIHASVQSDGFTVGDAGAVNTDSATYVAWQWKCNGGTRTTNTESGNNPAGGYQANTTAGFSIIDYTGTGATGTMAHGLGVIPEWIVFKARAGTENWPNYHVSTGNTHAVDLNRTVVKQDNDTLFNDTTPTSSVFTVGSDSAINADGVAYIAYCFTPIQGYSKFGSYVGNGNDDGPFIYTGFKPAMFFRKRTDGANGWNIWDNQRATFNEMHTSSAIHTTAAEDSNTGYNDIDFLSNGVKIHDTGDSHNGSDMNYIYCAWAESPFVTSEGIPATAR